MKSKNKNTPSEMVISAVHNLGERNGSSHQDIVRFISGKYKIDQKEIKSHIQAALNRCTTFGLLTQEAGLYRLNDETNDVPRHIIPTVFQNRKRRRLNNLKNRNLPKRRIRQRRKARRSKRNSNNLLVRKIYTTNLLGEKRRSQKNRKSSEDANKKRQIRKRRNNDRETEREGMMNGRVFKKENLESTSQENQIARDE